MAANKLRGIRAALCGDTYSARQSREHDDCNLLCLGARVVGVELALELVRAFVAARFSGEERHRRRLRKIEEMEGGTGGRGDGETRGSGVTRRLSFGPGVLPQWRQSRRYAKKDK